MLENRLRGQKLEIKPLEKPKYWGVKRPYEILTDDEADFLYDLNLLAFYMSMDDFQDKATELGLSIHQRLMSIDVTTSERRLVELMINRGINAAPPLKDNPSAWYSITQITQAFTILSFFKIGFFQTQYLTDQRLQYQQLELAVQLPKHLGKLEGGE